MEGIEALLAVCLENTINHSSHITQHRRMMPRQTIHMVPCQSMTQTGEPSSGMKLSLLTHTGREGKDPIAFTSNKGLAAEALAA